MQFSLVTPVRKRRLLALSSVLLSAIAFANPAAAAGFVTDAPNDFVATFTGTHDPSLDVLSFSTVFDGSVFHISGTEAGNISSFATGLFVVGFNRGAGNSNFAAIGHGGVTFDSVVTLSSAGVIGGNVLNLASVTAGINGASFFINVPLTSLPGLNGASPIQYMVNLWPRDISQAGNAAIADFAPDNSDLLVGIPEPLTVGMFASGLFGLALMRARKNKTI